MGLRDAGDPRRQVVCKPMEELMQHALLPFVRNKLRLDGKAVAARRFIQGRDV
jgi:hypothetical protein